MMERVRPAQLTTILVLGSGTSAPMRSASSPLGQETPPGMLILWNSAKVRPSMIARSSPASCIAFSAAAVTRGVCRACSTSSPNALLGTLTPA